MNWIEKRINHPSELNKKVQITYCPLGGGWSPTEVVAAGAAAVVAEAAEEAAAGVPAFVVAGITRFDKSKSFSTMIAIRSPIDACVPSGALTNKLIYDHKN